MTVRQAANLKPGDSVLIYGKQLPMTRYGAKWIKHALLESNAHEGLTVCLL